MIKKIDKRAGRSEKDDEPEGKEEEEEEEEEEDEEEEEKNNKDKCKEIIFSHRYDFLCACVQQSLCKHKHRMEHLSSKICIILVVITIYMLPCRSQRSCCLRHLGHLFCVGPKNER